MKFNKITVDYGWERFTFRPYRVPVEVLIDTLAPELNTDITIAVDLSDEAISKLIEWL